MPKYVRKSFQQQTCQHVLRWFTSQIAGRLTYAAADFCRKMALFSVRFCKGRLVIHFGIPAASTVKGIQNSSNTDGQLSKRRERRYVSNNLPMDLGLVSKVGLLSESVLWLKRQILFQYYWIFLRWGVSVIPISFFNYLEQECVSDSFPHQTFVRLWV